MSREPKRNKEVKYMPESLELALKEIREDGKGIQATCKKYGIPKTTIQDRISKMQGDEIQIRGPEPILGAQGEKKIVEWLVNLVECGFQIRETEILNAIQKHLRDLKKRNPFKNDRPGQKWYANFIKRYPEIYLRSAEIKKKASAGVTEQSVRLWFQELEYFLGEEGELEVLKHAERIFNASDISFSLYSKTGEVLEPKVYRNVQQFRPGTEIDNMTVLVTFNACGMLCPPLVMFPLLTNEASAGADNKPSVCFVGRSEFGCLTSEILSEYITNVLNAWVAQNGIEKPILLLVDGRYVPISLTLSSMCEQLGIILYALPPNTTHVLHPVQVSVLDQLKVDWEIMVKKFLSNPENEDLSVTLSNFCQLLREILDDPQFAPNIVKQFRKCGLFPHNPDILDYTEVENIRAQVKRPPPQCKKMKVIKRVKKT